jgi:hypothetical protein
MHVDSRIREQADRIVKVGLESVVTKFVVLAAPSFHVATSSGANTHLRPSEGEHRAGADRGDKGL